MVPRGISSRTRKPAIDFLALVTTGFWPVISARSLTAATIALPF